MARTEKPIPALNFEDTAIPEPTAAPNPFAPVVAALAKDWDTENDASKGAKSVVIPEADKARMRSRITEAAKDVGKSSRVTFSEPDKAGNVTMKFWLKPAIKRGEKVSK